MSSKRTVERVGLAVIALVMSSHAVGCPFSDPEPIAGSGGTSSRGAGGDVQGGIGGAGNGGESGFVGGSVGGGPSQGIDDGSSGITGRAGDGPSGASDH